MPRAGAAAPTRRTRVPPPRDESRTGSGDTEGPGKGETGLGKEGKRAEERFTPTLQQRFAPGWGEALPSPRDVNFLLQSRGERFHFKVGNKARRFFPAGAGRERDAEERESPAGGCSPPRDAESIARGRDSISGCLYELPRAPRGAAAFSLEGQETVRVLTPSVLFELWSL